MKLESIRCLLLVVKGPNEHIKLLHHTISVTYVANYSQILKSMALDVFLQTKTSSLTSSNSLILFFMDWLHCYQKSNEKCLELYPEISCHHPRNKWVTSWQSLLACHLVKRDYEDPIRLNFRDMFPQTKVWPLMCFSKQKHLSSPHLTYFYFFSLWIDYTIPFLPQCSKKPKVCLSSSWKVECVLPKSDRKYHLLKSFQKRICGTCTLLYSHGCSLCYIESPPFPWSNISKP